MSHNMSTSDTTATAKTDRQIAFEAMRAKSIEQGHTPQTVPDWDDAPKWWQEQVEAGAEAVAKPLRAQIAEMKKLLPISRVTLRFVGNGPYPMQLVCTTEDASDRECDETITEVQPGVAWDELERRIAAHAVERHAASPPRAAELERMVGDLRNLAADLEESARVTSPSKKSEIEQRCARTIRTILDDLPQRNPGIAELEA